MNQRHSFSASIQKKRIIQLLETTFPGISTLQLPDDQYCLQQLSALQLYVRYSIPFINYPQNVRQFYLKISDLYWENQIKSRQNNSLKKYKEKNIIQQKVLQTTQQIPTDQQIVNHLIQENNQSVDIKDPIQINQPIINEQSQKQLSQIEGQQIISMKLKKKNYTYKQIMQQLTVNSFQKVSEYVYSKVKQTNDWKFITEMTKGFCQKKQKTNIQNLKVQIANKKKQKEIKKQIQTPKIIIGKNQSVQTRQIKHQLKLKAKQSYAQNKQKQQLSMNQLQKNYIQLTYLLNMITPQYFQEFYQQIKGLILKNQNCIPILCLKIIQKIKQQHNFIDIYVLLVRNICKLNKKQFTQDQSNFKVNKFQRIFVESYQIQFEKLLSNQQNLDQHFYKKQIKGFFIMIGKLIQNKTFSKYIFKACFWELLLKYLQNSIQKPEKQTINECLLEGIFIMAQNMEYKYFQLINSQQKTDKNSKFKSEFFQDITKNIYNPQLRQQLIADTKPSDYLNVLKTISSLIKSQRRKIQFLIKTLQQKTALNQNSQTQSKAKIQVEIQNLNKVTEKKQYKEKYSSENYFTQIKQNSQENVSNLIDLIMQKSLLNLVSIQQLIDNLVKFKQIFTSDLKIQFIQQFLLQFADGNKKIANKRCEFFIQLIKKYETLSENVLSTIIKSFQRLMLVSCDLPYLASGIAKIIDNLQCNNSNLVSQIQDKINLKDEDIYEFWQDIHSRMQCKRQD